MRCNQLFTQAVIGPLEDDGTNIDHTQHKSHGRACREHRRPQLDRQLAMNKQVKAKRKELDNLKKKLEELQ